MQVRAGFAARWRLLLCAFWAIQCGSLASPLPTAEDFALTEFDSQRTARLSDFNGRIVVLDFFAYWCVPCLPASRALESDVRDYFSARGGNAHGIPVELLSINVEAENPERTREFVARAGIRRTYDDPEGKLLARFGGEGLPFIVILDGHRSTTNQFEWHVVHRQAGLESVQHLRTLIDSIGKEQTAIDLGRSHRGGATATQTAEFAAEFLNTDDVHLSSYKVLARHVRAHWDGQLTATYQLYDLTYRPDIFIPDLFFSRDLREDTWSGQLALKGNLVTDWKWLVGGGYYDGFADYKSVWLDEYYRQSFSGLQGYEEADPWGYNVSAGVRWDYLPAAGFVQVEGAYQRDAVSPSYDKPLFEPLVRGLDLIETWSGRVSLENVMTRRLRMRKEFQIVQSTERDLRYAYQHQANYALAEHWTIKGVLGGTWEPPDFSAYLVEGTVEYDWEQRWYGRVFGHYYVDDGQLRDPSIISSAQPALDAFWVGLGIRYVYERIAVDVSGGPYFTRYDPLPANAGDFANLYRDRDWWLAKIGIAYRF